MLVAQPGLCQADGSGWAITGTSLCIDLTAHEGCAFFVTFSVTKRSEIFETLK